MAPSLGAFSCVFISSIPRWYQHEKATHRRAQQPGLGSSFSSLAPRVRVCAAAAMSGAAVWGCIPLFPTRPTEWLNSVFFFLCL